MGMIEWDHSLSVGIESLDAQHRTLLRLLNELQQAMAESRSREVLGEILEQLLEYVDSHFADEEALFATHRYPETAEHCRQHAVLADKARQLHRDHSAGAPALSIEVLGFLETWLKTHIKGSDMHYGAFLRQHGVK